MTTARKAQISLADTPYYHCVARKTLHEPAPRSPQPRAERGYSVRESPSTRDLMAETGHRDRVAVPPPAPVPPSAAIAPQTLEYLTHTLI